MADVRIARVLAQSVDSARVRIAGIASASADLTAHVRMAGVSVSSTTSTADVRIAGVLVTTDTPIVFLRTISGWDHALSMNSL